MSAYGDQLEVDSWSVHTHQAGTGTLISIAEYHVHHQVDITSFDQQQHANVKLPELGGKHKLKGHKKIPTFSSHKPSAHYANQMSSSPSTVHGTMRPVSSHTPRANQENGTIQGQSQ